MDDMCLFDCIIIIGAAALALCGYIGVQLCRFSSQISQNEERSARMPTAEETYRDEEAV